MKKLVLDNKETKHLVSKICREISNQSWRPDYVVGLTRGGLVPAVMISHWFNVPCNTLKVALRDNQDAESNLWMAEDAFGYVPEDEREVLKSRWDHSKKKNILIVDDINDTGATFNWIMQDWVSGCLPEDAAWKDIWNHNVKFAVLVDNQASKCNVKMNFFGIEINKAEDDVWVDFPWEDWWTK